MGVSQPLLEVSSVSKTFAQLQVAHDISFELQRGEIGCLLGPSGCGKTTLLRVIAGFERIGGGVVKIAGDIVSSRSSTVPPEKRSIGMVFQDYALFPHMSVYENVAFGLSRMPLASRKNKVSKMLFLVGLPDIAEKYPHELSGGQQQRVALARALAPEPELLLLDEPFSNLDATLREKLSVEVRDIIKELGATALLVTHNQHEAFSVADKIGVIFHGRMNQWDTGYDIYHRPASMDVATFVGDGVLISGTVVSQDTISSGLGTIRGNLSCDCQQGCEVDFLVRPEDIVHVDASAVRAKVVHTTFRGPNILYTLQLDSGESCLALVSSHHNHQVGEDLGIMVEMDNIVVFPKDTVGN